MNFSTHTIIYICVCLCILCLHKEMWRKYWNAILIGYFFFPLLGTIFYLQTSILKVAVLLYNHQSFVFFVITTTPPFPKPKKKYWNGFLSKQTISVSKKDLNKFYNNITTMQSNKHFSLNYSFVTFSLCTEQVWCSLPIFHRNIVV